jgi:hypothetical protein
MARLNYSGETDGLSKGDATSLVAQTVDVDEAGNGISVDSLSMRVNGGSIWLSISVSASGPMAEMEALADTIAQGAVDLGLEPDTQTARESVQISGGVN